MDKIVAVTVTFNDSSHLEKQLASLHSQTLPVFKTIIVDNNSNEENKSRLRQQASEKEDVIWLSENSGGAGGFEAGMRYAQEKYDPDWYWLMDSDAYPCKDCAEKLFAYKEYDINIGVLAPIIYGMDLNEYQLYHHKRIDKYLYRDLQIFKTYNDVPSVSFIEADAFVGPMIAKKAVDSLGVPDGNLFIYGDDIEYTYRISQRYRILLVRDAVMNHRDQPVNGEQKPENWWKDYYAFRNRIFFIKKYSKNTFEYVIGIFFLCMRCFKRIMDSFSMPYSRKMTKTRRRVLFESIYDGFRGLNGKTLDPLKFKQEIKDETILANIQD